MTVLTRTPTRLRPWFRGLLMGYLGIVLALTCLKSWFTVGDLWSPGNQRTRDLRLEPFGILDDASTSFGAAFDIVGNVVLFIPLGVLLVAVTGRFLTSVGLAAGLSLCIETGQYLFMLGRSDITDLICNSAGAVLGSAVALPLTRTVTRRIRGAR